MFQSVSSLSPSKRHSNHDLHRLTQIIIKQVKLTDAMRIWRLKRQTECIKIATMDDAIKVYIDENKANAIHETVLDNDDDEGDLVSNEQNMDGFNMHFDGLGQYKHKPTINMNRFQMTIRDHLRIMMLLGRHMVDFQPYSPNGDDDDSDDAGEDRELSELSSTHSDPKMPPLISDSPYSSDEDDDNDEANECADGGGDDRLALGMIEHDIVSLYNVPRQHYNVIEHGPTAASYYDSLATKGPEKNIAMLMDFFKRIVCAGDRNKQRFWADFVYQLILYPTINPHVLIVLSGPKGCGKSIWTYVIEQMMGGVDDDFLELVQFGRPVPWQWKALYERTQAQYRSTISRPHYMLPLLKKNARRIIVEVECDEKDNDQQNRISNRRPAVVQRFGIVHTDRQQRLKYFKRICGILDKNHGNLAFFKKLFLCLTTNVPASDKKQMDENADLQRLFGQFVEK